MQEKVIYLQEIQPVELYGANNIYLDQIKERLPKLKLIARGETIKVQGEENDISDFHERFKALEGLITKGRLMNDNLIDEVFGNSRPVPVVPLESDNHIILYGNNGNPIRARTTNQIKMVTEIERNDIVFAIGPAGTGKTYTAVAVAVRALKNKEIKRIILTRPAVEAGESLGFLPGDLKEKIDPYLRPLYDALGDMVPPDKLQTYIENRTIEVAPLAFMRGRTLDNCIVILDEAQNTTDLQLKMFLTRMGPSAKLIITGDMTQVDLPQKQVSGLTRAVHILKDINGIRIVHLDVEDVVRHRLVKNIIRAYMD